MTDGRSAGLQLTVDAHPTGVRIGVRGDLDLATVEPLVECVTEQLKAQEAAGAVALDLAGVPFCDSSGISGLVGVRKLCDESGWTLSVTGMVPTVRRVVVDIAGLGDYLGVSPDPS